jgi:hypothetical protein
MVAAELTLSEEQVDPETLRSYIDKVDRAFASAATSSSRLQFANILLAVALGAIALGAVSVEEKFEIQGLSFSMPLTSLLVGASATSLALTCMSMATTHHTLQLGQELVALYRRLGFEVPSSLDSMRNPWSSAGPLEVLISGEEVSTRATLRAVDTLVTVGVLIAIFVLPIAAQAIACGRTANALGGDLAWLLLLFPVASAGATVAIGTRTAINRGP